MPKFERVIETILFQSRWALAPFYLGLVVCLLLMLVHFMRELIHFVIKIRAATESDVILGVLALIDLTFTANLVLIVIFSGYENFVSKFESDRRPSGLDDQGRLRRAQAEADDLDRRDLRDPGAQGVHEHRPERRRAGHRQARLAGGDPRVVPRFAAGGRDRGPDLRASGGGKACEPGLVNSSSVDTKN